MKLLAFYVISHIFVYSKDVRLPVQLQRAMAAEAEAAREARAKVIAAEGEQKASRALREASEVIGDSPAALQLRYLQVNIFLFHTTYNMGKFKPFYLHDVTLPFNVIKTSETIPFFSEAQSLF